MDTIKTKEKLDKGSLYRFSQRKPEWPQKQAVALY